MPYSIRLPDGTTVANIPDNIPFEDAKRDILKRRPDLAAAAEPPVETAGLGEALKGGAKQFGRTFGTGVVGAFAPEEAAQRFLKETKEEPIKQATSLEAVKQKYLESGFFPAAGEALSQIPGAIAEQFPNLVATAAGARLGAMAGAPLGLPGVIGGGVLGAATPSLIQSFGQNIGRQAEEQRAAIEAGAAPDISRGAAAAAAVPQAALDVAAQRLIFGKQLVARVLGRTPEEIAKLEGKALVAAERKAEKIAKEGLAKTLSRGVATGVIGEVPTEVAQQMLERAQAGLPLFDDEAKQEYLESAYGAALVSPLGAVGSISERGAAREGVAAREAQRQQAEAQLTQLATGVGGVGENYAAQQALLGQYDTLSRTRAELKERKAELEKTGNRIGLLDVDEQLDALDEQEKQLQEQAKELNVPLTPSPAYAGPRTIEAEIADLEKQYGKAKTVEDRAKLRDQLRAAYARLEQLTAPEEVPAAEGFTAPEPKKRGKKGAKAATPEGEVAEAGAEAVEEPEVEVAPPLVGPVLPKRYTPAYGEMLVKRLRDIETETQRPKGVGLQAEKNRQANLFGAFNTLLEDARNLEYSKTDEDLAEDLKDGASYRLENIQDYLNTLKERFIESATDEIRLAREEAGVAPISDKELSDVTDKLDQLLTEIANRTATPNFNKRQGEAVDPEQERFNFSVAERRRLVKDYGLDERVDQQLALLTREINKLSQQAAKFGATRPGQATKEALQKLDVDLLEATQNRDEAQAELDKLTGVGSKASFEEGAKAREALMDAKARVLEVTAQIDKVKGGSAEQEVSARAEKNAGEIRRINAQIDSLYKDRADLLLNNLRAQLARIKNEAAYGAAPRPGLEEAAAGAKAKVAQRAKEEEALEAAAYEPSPVRPLPPLAERQARAKEADEADQRRLETLISPTAKTSAQEALDNINETLTRGYLINPKRKLGTKGQIKVLKALKKRKAELEKKLKKEEVVKAPESGKAGLSPLAEAKRVTRLGLAENIKKVRKILFSKTATPKEKAEARATLKDLRGKIKKGAISYEAAVPKLMLAGKKLAELKNEGRQLRSVLSYQADLAVKRRDIIDRAAEARKEGRRDDAAEIEREYSIEELKKRAGEINQILAANKAVGEEVAKLTKETAEAKGKIISSVDGETLAEIDAERAAQIDSIKKYKDSLAKQGLLFDKQLSAAEVARLEAELKEVNESINLIETAPADRAAALVRQRKALYARQMLQAQVAKIQSQLENVTKELRDVGNLPATKEEERAIGAEERAKMRRTRTQKAVEEVAVAEPVNELDVLREAGIDTEFSMDADGNVFRRGSTRTPVAEAEAKATIDKVKVPKGVKFEYAYTYDALPDSVKAQLKDDGATKGAVLPNGTVVVIGNAHSNTADIQKTIAHEVVGHYGVDVLLGPKGMKDLTDRTMRMQGGIQKLAESFGKDVGEATLSTAIYYQRMADAARAAKNESRAKQLEEIGKIQAMRELIAHVEETRPTAGFVQKANRFIKELVGYVRAALRKMGLLSYDKVSTSDIYKLLRDARKAVGAQSGGVYVSPTGEIAFRKEAATYSASVNEAARRATGIVGANRAGVRDVLGSNLGLQFVTRFVDRFAPLERVAAFMKDSAQATQMMYFLRMHDQGIAWTQAALTKGPLKIERDAKGYLMIKAEDGPNVKDMVEALKDANVGNPEATKQLFTAYLLAERAEIVGYDKLKSDLGDKVNKADLKAVLDLGRSNAAFQKAKKIYNDHNNGLLDFLVETGAMSKEVAQNLRNKSYVPYYREDKDGNVEMVLGGEKPISVGNVKDQPYLHELVGGNKNIIDVFASSIQNTRLLTDMALRNLATRNAAFGLQSAGMLKDNRINNGSGPAAKDVIRFKIDGEEKYAVVDSDKAGIPAELLVSGMEGVKVMMPLMVRMLSAPAGILRKFITRNPVYAMRQLVRDSTTNYFLTGADVKPLGSAAANFYKLYANKKDGSMPDLQSRGIISGNVLTGTSEQMEDILLNMVSGKPGWEQYMAKLDIMAQRADESSRISIYNDFRKQGLSDMEATMATLESMNFNKRGTSPSIFMLNAMVPFLNAQIQGLNVLVKSLRGTMPFAERLKQRKKLVNRAMFMVATTAAYALMMSDDEAYETSDPVDRYNNWFVRVPGLDEPVRVPIPFEVGLLFKAIPEAMIDAMRDDAKAEQAYEGMKRLFANSMPIGPSSLPAGIKPIIELTLGSSFYTGMPIESEREKRLMPEYRTREKTTEISKAIGSMLGVSPIQLDYLINGYFSGTGLALAGLGNFILRSPDAPQPAEKTLSEMPVIGALFQTNTGSGYVNTFYRQAEQIEQAKATFDALIKKGDADGAARIVETSANDIAMDGFVSSIKQQLADIREAEKLIRNADIDPKEKAKTIKDLRISAAQLAKAANLSVSALQ